MKKIILLYIALTLLTGSWCTPKAVYKLIIVTEVSEISGSHFIPLECVVNAKDYDGSSASYMKINSAIEAEIKVKYKNRKIAFFNKHNGSDKKIRHVVVLTGVCYDSFLGRKKKLFTYSIKPSQKEAMEEASTLYKNITFGDTKPSVMVDTHY